MAFKVRYDASEKYDYDFKLFNGFCGVCIEHLNNVCTIL